MLYVGRARVCAVLQFVEYLTFPSGSAQPLPSTEFLRSGVNFVMKDIIGMVLYFLRASRFECFVSLHLKSVRPKNYA